MGVGPMSWPGGGAWVVTTTSTSVDWELAAAALAVAAKTRVALLVVDRRAGPSSAAGELLRAAVATYAEVSAGAADPVREDDAVALVRALAGTHGLVLVVGPDGLLAPLGSGWTPADLARALPAPVVVVADADPDAANHATLVLDALTSRGLTASVVAVGTVEEFDDLFDKLPVALAGRIPADAADRPDRFPAEAPGWLDPLLHGTRGRPAEGGAAAGDDGTTDEPGTARPTGEPGAPEPTGPPRSTVAGKRVVQVLLAMFVLALLVLCAINWMAPTRSSLSRGWGSGQARVTAVPRPFGTGAVHVSAVPRPRPSATTVCPQNTPNVVDAQPDAATTGRVDAAWDRIERWLAAHAPAANASLRPPAPSERLTSVQARMSVPFPPDLVASLRRHDGAAPRGGFLLPMFYRPLPVDEIFTNWEITCGVLAEVGGPQPDWWNRAFVPFATDGGGGCLLVDQRPGGHGRVGEFYPEDGTRFDRWPASVVELLEQTASALETGQPYAGRYRPVVSPDGQLTWE